MLVTVLEWLTNVSLFLQAQCITEVPCLETFFYVKTLERKSGNVAGSHVVNRKKKWEENRGKVN